MTAATRAATLAVAMAATGCASHASRHGATVVAPGRWQTVLALDALVFEHGRDYAVYPAPEVAVRRGMQGWDLGGKLGAGNAELSARFALRRGGPVVVALVPGVRFAIALLTNNGTDLVRGTGFGHVVLERALTARLTLVTTATAAITAAGPMTITSGRAGDTRALAEPALGVGLRLRIGGRTLWPEATVTLPYPIGDGLERPLIQAGIAVEL